MITQTFSLKLLQSQDWFDKWCFGVNGSIYDRQTGDEWRVSRADHTSVTYRRVNVGPNSLDLDKSYDELMKMLDEL